MTTQEIINDMRSNTITSMRAAADRLEDLQRANKNTLADLALAVSERRFSQQITAIRPEPSRLEIAAMAMQGMLAASSFDTLRLSKSALEYAEEAK